MCGLPSAGKSEFVDALVVEFPAIVIRSQKSDDGDKNINNWYDILNETTKVLYNSDKNIILDTCGASPKSFNEIFTMASVKSHLVVVIWVNANKNECAKRFDGDRSIVGNYIPKIKNAVREYQSKYKLLVVTNDGTLEELRDKARIMANKLWQMSGAKKQ